MLLRNALVHEGYRGGMKLIFIYGPPASGKLTIARKLSELTGLPVFHNHLIVDAVQSVFPFGTPTFNALRESFWLTMMREAARERRSLLVTFAPEPTVA
jgi:dephospho-CoA kinase